MAMAMGSAVSLQWIHPAGTAVFNTDFQQLDYTPSVELVEETAGADPAKLYRPAQVDGKVSYQGIYQAAGTVLLDSVKEGTMGTLIWGYEGTATGARKCTAAAIAQGAQMKAAYNGRVEISVEWQQNGARTDAAF